MMSVGGLGGVLLLLAAQPLLSAAPGNGSAAATTHVQFAPGGTTDDLSRDHAPGGA